MDTIPEEVRERALGRDEVDGFKIDDEGECLFKANNIVGQGVDFERLSSNSGHCYALECLCPHHKGRVRPSDYQSLERDQLPEHCGSRGSGRFRQHQDDPTYQHNPTHQHSPAP